MEHLPVKEIDELQGIVPTGEELTLLWHTEMGVGKSSLLDVRAATATYIDHVSATVEAIDPDAAPRVEVEETENDATGRHRGYIFHHFLPSGVAIDDVSIGTVSSLPARSAPTAAIRDVSVDDETTDVDERKTHKRYKVDFGIPAPYDVDVDMTATVLNANEEPTAAWTAEHTNAKKQWHLTLGLPKSKGISLKPVTVLNANGTPTVIDEGDVNEARLHFSLPQAKDVSVLPVTVAAAGSEPAVKDEGDVNNSALRFSLPAPWDISLDVNATALAAGTAPTAQLIPSHSGNTKHWTLELGLSTGEQGIQGEQGVQGEQGIQGERGIDGKTGRTPIITITAGEHYGEYGTPSITQTTADNGDTTITLDYMRGPSMDEFVAPPISAGVEGAIWIA